MLTIIRIVFIVVFFFLSKMRRKESVPAAWMLHYLLGSGKSKRVQRRIAQEGLLSALKGKYMYNHWDEILSGYEGISSVDYDGRGFVNRPTLFYLVGGFTMRIKAWDRLTLTGSDTYNWHGDDEGRYYVSPVRFPNWVLKVLDFVTGRNEYFIHSRNSYCSITGEVGVSNKLWMAMEWVGARPFTSTFTTNISWKEWWDYVNEGL